MPRPTRATTSWKALTAVLASALTSAVPTATTFGALALAVSTTACVRGKTQSVPPEMTWAAWHVLEPLLRDAQFALDEDTMSALQSAAQALNEQRVRDADEILVAHASGTGRHWIAAARGDLAALHFERCIRGVAWRLPTGPSTRREIDFDPNTRIEGGDISVEAMLSALDLAVQHAQRDEQSALLRHARIARARVTGFTVRCAPNEDVARQADEVMRADLAVLAAQDALPPDLAYVWAGIQYEVYSPQAARPFLLAAAEQGFDDPSVDLLLANIALDARDFAEARSRADAAIVAYREIGATAMTASALALRGEARRRLGELDEAQADFRKALEVDPSVYEAVVGLTRLSAAREGPDAAARFLRSEMLAAIGEDTADPEPMQAAAQRLEALVLALNTELELAQIAREALLHEVDLDDDALRRALRYYYAATLDVALGDYDAARGHAATAELEFEAGGVPSPEGVRAMLESLAGPGAG